MYEPLVVAKVSSYIHSGNCPSSWAISQHQILAASAYTYCQLTGQLTSAIAAITWHVSEFEKKSQRLLWPSCQLKNFPTPLPKAKPTDIVIRYNEAVF